MLADVRAQQGDVGHGPPDQVAQLAQFIEQQGVRERIAGAGELFGHRHDLARAGDAFPRVHLAVATELADGGQDFTTDPLSEGDGLRLVGAESGLIDGRF